MAPTYLSFFTTLTSITLSLAQELPSGVIHPLISTCGPSTANIACVHKYAAVMPYHFFREVSYNTTDITFPQTSVPNDTSLSLTKDANFLVFDQTRGLALLGPNATYDKVFNVSMAVHEAPVYVPGLERLYFSQLAPPVGFLPQLMIDLSGDSPVLSEFLSDPPVYAPNGGTYHNGLVYWGKISPGR